MLKEEKINLIKTSVAIIITSILMFVFIGQKHGWHEDEIFSYGSSNYRYDNTFQRFGYRDSLNELLDEKIIDSNPVTTLKNAVYYITHSSEFSDELHKKMKNETPVWKTPEQAMEFLTISKDDIFNYWSVYYNQSRDVHPPLFYILVHFVSCLFLNRFSKYIIFSINLAFYIAVCIMMRAVMKLFGKDKFSWLAILLYGLSMGGISTVMFQRMYIMLTFFILAYIYLNLKIIKSNFEIDKKTKKLLFFTVIGGFLTQYHFCFYAAFLAAVMVVIMKKKKSVFLKDYISCHIKSAIVGILLFPASIYHIFFSYRGIGGTPAEEGFLTKLTGFMDLSFYAFSMPRVIGYICLTVCILFSAYKLYRSRQKAVIAAMAVPPILFFLIIVKTVPFVNIRYIAILFPLAAIGAILIISSALNDISAYLLQNNKSDRTVKLLGMPAALLAVIVLSVYGLVSSKPEFLYTEYTEKIKIADTFSSLKLVYVDDANFVHMKDMEEFLRYKSSLIVTKEHLGVLKNNEGLDGEHEFILDIKTWIEDYDKVFIKVLGYTNASECTLLYEDDKSRIYKVTID